MDYLQYKVVRLDYEGPDMASFKPYYKWITFNTQNIIKL